MNIIGSTRLEKKEFDPISAVCALGIKTSCNRIGEKMIHFLVLFPKSIDPDVVDRYVSDLNKSLKEARGLKTLTLSDGDLMSPGGPPAYSTVLEANFDSLENFMGWVNSPWVQSPEAQAEKNFMVENGAVLVFYDVVVQKIG